MPSTGKVAKNAEVHYIMLIIKCVHWQINDEWTNTQTFIQQAGNGINEIFVRYDLRF